VTGSDQAVTVAALYVQTNGVYYGLPGVDPWGERRDARRYPGPWPVVAHPPCKRWSILAPLVESQYGYAVGDDGGCFAAALAAVRRFGGVIEHPALSFAWDAFDLPEPVTHGWQGSFTDPGWSTEVAQSAYGHPARKRTWLYYVGASDPPALDWREPPAETQVCDQRRRNNAPYASDERRLSPSEREETPIAFRDALLAIARNAAPTRATVERELSARV
jgi:hypothetical protein